MKPTPLVLLAHGSKHRQWLEPFERLADDLRLDVGRDNVQLCYMEIASPTLMDIASALAATGISKCRVLPLFMAAGTHLSADVPEHVARIQKRFPGLEIELLPPIGQHPLFLKLMHQLAKETVRS